MNLLATRANHAKLIMYDVLIVLPVRSQLFTILGFSSQHYVCSWEQKEGDRLSFLIFIQEMLFHHSFCV